MHHSVLTMSVLLWIYFLSFFHQIPVCFSSKIRWYKTHSYNLVMDKSLFYFKDVNCLLYLLQVYLYIYLYACNFVFGIFLGLCTFCMCEGYWFLTVAWALRVLFLPHVDYTSICVCFHRLWGVLFPYLPNLLVSNSSLSHIKLQN